MTFKLFLEAEKAPYVYHVTFMKNIPGIMSSKLIPFGGVSPFPKMEAHCKKGVFFSDKLSSAKEWINSLLPKYRYFRNKDFLPVVLRFKLNRNTWNKDDKTNFSNCFYTHKAINPLGLEFWDGSNWTKNASEVKKLEQYKIIEDEDGWRYPFPKS